MSVISFFFPLPRVVSKQTQLNHNTLCPTVFPSGRSYHKTTTQHQQCRPLKGKGDRRKFFFFYFHHFKQSSNKLPSFSTFRGRSKASSSISFHIAISPALLPHFHAISHSSCFFFLLFCVNWSLLPQRLTKQQKELDCPLDIPLSPRPFAFAASSLSTLAVCRGFGNVNNHQKVCRGDDEETKLTKSCKPRLLSCPC